MAKAARITKKGPGRPMGAAGVKNIWKRDEILSTMRVSEGFNKTLQHLIDDKHYKSKADAMHEALQLLAIRKLTDSAQMFWVHRI